MSTGNSFSDYGSNSSHTLTSSIPKGLAFGGGFVSNDAPVLQYDNYTFKFNKRGVYRIDYRVTANIHENNNVSSLFIRPSVSTTLTASGEFLNYSDFGIQTTRKRVQTTTNIEASPYAVDTICDYCFYTYNDSADTYFKLLVWGPNTSQSYIEAGARVTFTLIEEL